MKVDQNRLVMDGYASPLYNQRRPLLAIGKLAAFRDQR